MNKYKFIDYLHHPKKITKDQEDKLIEVVEEYPYFQTARTLIAKIKSEQKDPASKNYVSAASLYVFDRAYLRKYLGTDLFFIESKETAQERKDQAAKTLDKPVAESIKKQAQPSRAIKAPTQAKASVTPTQGIVRKQKPPTSQVVPSQPKPAEKKAENAKLERTKAAPSVQKGTEPSKVVATTKPSSATPIAPPKADSDLDKLIEEVFQDMSDLRKSKARFLEWQEKNDMEEAVEKAMAASLDQEPTTVPQDTSEVVPDDKHTAGEPEQKTDKPEKSDSPEITEIAPEDPTPVDAKEADASGKTQVSKTRVTPKKPKPTATKTAAKTSSKKPAAKKKAPVKKAPAKKSTTPEKKTASKTSTAKKTTTKNTAKKTKTGKKDEGKDAPSSSAPEVNKQASSKVVTEKKEPIRNKVVASSEPVEPEKELKSPTEEKNNPSDKEAIIDKFIETQPSISKPSDEETVSKDDLSKKSTRFHADIASEYLAEIYIEQGKKHRAIEIYENMCLKFPEKKSYFAGLIENLKKE